jgi:hypothetical protein
LIYVKSNGLRVACGLEYCRAHHRESAHMRMTVALVLVSAVAACGVDTAEDPETNDLAAESDFRLNPRTDVTEPVFVNGQLCNQIFPGANTPQTQIYQIWPIGTRGIVNATYNTPQRPNLYAVFGTSAPLSQSHHVDGFDYHIADVPPGAGEVENTTWDVLAFFPGPSYNAATYTPAKSAAQVFAQSAAGILTPLMTLPEAGFPELVLFTPIQCHGD